MPYKDKSAQRAAQARSYLRNREQHIIDTNTCRAKRRVELHEYIKGFKDMKPCTDCGQSYPYYVMDFDHVRGAKVASISVLVHETARRDAIDDEMAKCDLVCANCHRERTFNRGESISL